MISIHGEEHYFDIDFWNSPSEMCYDNGTKYYLLQILEWKRDKNINKYTKYVLADTTKSVSLTILTELFKENAFVELICRQGTIIDLKKVVRNYILGERV